MTVVVHLAETKQILSLVAITLLIAVTSVAIVANVGNLFSGSTGEIAITDYQATFYLNGTLVETYTYQIKAYGTYRMLYRAWEVPISFQELDSPSVQVLEIEPPYPGIYVYVKDHSGSVYLFPEDVYARYDVEQLAYTNEVGVLNPNHFPPGTYKVSYRFVVHPPIEYDDDFKHLNLKFASTHMAYGKVTITIEDGNRVLAVYPHPPNLMVEKRDDKIIVRGISGEDQLLEVELLLEKSSLSDMRGFENRVDNVRSKTEVANLFYALPYYLATYIMYVTYALVFALPIAFLFMYFKYGKERRYDVPEYLSFVPSMRKPWVVNLIFGSDVNRFDENGLYATLLDLQRRGKIRFKLKNPSEPNSSGLLIQTIEPSRGEDDYEDRVLSFLNANAVNSVFDTDYVKELLEKTKKLTYVPSDLTRIRSGLDSLVSYSNKAVVSNFAVSGRSRVTRLLLAPAIIFFISLLMLISVPYAFDMIAQVMALSFVGIVQTVIGIAFPSTLFGRWRGDRYKEKLEWDAFRNMLSDLAQIKKYAPQDISMWGEWLIYGTALGVGDKVRDAMKTLYVKIPEFDNLVMMPIILRPVISTPIRTVSSSGGHGGSGGGGFGGGGGLGGGGGGAR